MTEDERRAIEADCERLIKRSINLSDAHDWDAVAALYTEDARFARPSQPGVFIEGREAILASFLARPPREQRHVVSNVVVDVEDAGHARAFSVIVLYQGEAAPMVGTYTDRLVRTVEGWRFAERVGGLDFRP